MTDIKGSQELITEELVRLDANLGSDSTAVIDALAAVVAENGRATTAEDLAADAKAREAKTATGVPGGIAIPHCRSAAVTVPTLGMARLDPAVDFGAKDGPADLVFFIAAPDGADKDHLKLLSKLARALVKKDFTAALRAAQSPAEIVELVRNVVAPAESGTTAAPAAAAPAAAADEPVADAAPSTKPKLVAVTACPTGIAHTYMAADSIAQAAEESGVEIAVETQGSSGATPLDPAVIAAADAVIFAVDVDVRDRHRFAGKPVIQVPVKRGIDEPAELIKRAVAAASDPNARRVPSDSGSGANESEQSGGKESVGAALKRALLTGVSYMIPFVAGGGLLIALGFLLGGYDITDVADDILGANTLFNLPEGGLAAYLGAVAFKIGALSMGFLVPALAGYIAFAFADRPGIAPGFTAGAVAGFMGAGFLGGIVGGLIAGLAARWITSWSVPRWLRGLMPVVIVPLLGSIIASGLMFLFLGGPIASLTDGLNNWLSGMTGTAAALLGLILGLMMAFDLGGPVNKVAYSFAVAGLGAGSLATNSAPLMIMAAVMAAGMVPPLAMALATAISPKQFSLAERENGKAAWLLGAAFISEGAIPFAAADPLRVIPASMIGAATTGAMIMSFDVVSQAPHGGIFVFFAMDGTWPMFIVATLVGTVISAAAVLALKKFARKSVPAEVAA
ncbi:PTS fructose transporter subunit IIABC [Zhihengliuella halotolerans]|uniref:PTS system D-fructose-specific IIA component (F1P-forming) (Frc family) /PTS system D-fructose-specific IIB component (F1P-forming) (Frc family) /PTS system D-fructose-specific IIC component (F1P-f... n=1 Tax=Zhihengliuella halotolerans TaxID=370736 RepID=A0A4Q8AG30_9MICC|nr:fructose-specific PTS transporter subunit EIIC [Zhihengliuella halotolerans]RZU62599.1 PTS system D-fructose-specific IIA component (F1P-forming) (Frc family) /PTS system D-fructose-specific IIB component (F1P-forming) (Frc family) /PTS system D-fructose-specific IIC component (F1P-forming) (Frc family) [Zhihengliuella halotolerans]